MMNHTLHTRRGASARPGRVAFTLIELLVVIANVALLFAILHPILASAKSRALRSVAALEMKQIMFAVQRYAYDHEGQAPSSLKLVLPYYGSELVDLGDERYEVYNGRVAISYLNPPQLEWLDVPRRKCNYFASQFDGNLFEIDCAERVVLATARVVGYDDFEIHGYADGSHKGFAITSTSPARQTSSLAVASGIADEAISEEELEARIRAVQLRGVEVVLELLRLTGDADFSLTTLKQDLSNPNVTALASLLLDCDEDGLLTVQDLRIAAEGEKFENDDGELSPELQILVDYIRESVVVLGLDQDPAPGNERLELPVEWVARVAEFEAADLFSFTDACELSAIYVTDPHQARGLCAKLAAAENAELRGQYKTRDSILGAFRNQVREHSGLSDEDAESLELLSWILQSDTD